MLDNNLFELMSTSEVANAADIETMDFVLNLEVLNGCAHHCNGCFVRRKNQLLDVDLDTALELALSMNKTGLRFREIILSPTDIFSATNSLEVLEDPRLHELLAIHPKTRITTTAMFEDLDWENWLAVWALLDNPDYFRSDMIMEFLVPINPEKILEGDEKYYADFQRALDFMRYETPKEVDWSFVVNVQYDPLIAENYDELTRIAREEFNTTIEFLPSFFRTGNDMLIKDHLAQWRTFLRDVVNEDNVGHTMLTIADKNHNGLNTIVVNYRRGSLYISPFIYEQILYEYPELKVDGFGANAVMDKVEELIVKQVQYAPQTTECVGCDYMMSCVGRNVLSFMEIKGIKDCVFPKDVLDRYNAYGIDPRADRVKRCESKTTTE